MSSAYVVRCSTTKGTALSVFPEGRFLGWRGGYLKPFYRPECASHYRSQAVAWDVAGRAEAAYPGARFEVVPVDVEVLRS